MLRIKQFPAGLLLFLIPVFGAAAEKSAFFVDHKEFSIM
jgi:hypothetical protein